MLLAKSIFLLILIAVLIVFFVFLWNTRIKRYTSAIFTSPLSMIFVLTGFIFSTELLIMFVLEVFNEKEVISIMEVFQSFTDAALLSLFVVPVIYFWMKKEEKYLHLVTDNIGDALLVVNDNGKIEYYNPAAERLFAYSSDEIKGKDVSLLFVDETSQHSVWDSLITGGQYIANMGKEVEGKRKDGTTFPSYVVISEAIINDLRVHIAIIEDITERKQVESTLRESEERFRKMFQKHTAVMLLIEPVTGRIIDANAAAAKFYGYTYDKLLGMTISDINTLPEEKLLEKRIEAIVHKQNSFVFDHKLANGEIRIVEAYSAPIDLNSQKLLFSIINDITEKKKEEEELVRTKQAAEAANIAKSEFLANMSHEIRTPLSSIMGMSELLSESPMNKEQKEYVAILKKSGEHLLELVNDILDMSNIETGRVELHHYPFSLSEILHKIDSRLAPEISRKGLKLKYSIDKEIPDNLNGDATRLTQVLLNLAGNAVKFTQKGEILISVKQKSDIPEDHKMILVFEVKDNGIGVAPDKIETIFNTFSQADTSNTRQYGGTGLGLAISRKLVELMGGYIWVESTLGAGSTFFFTSVFSVSDSDNKIDAAQSVLADTSSIPDNQKKILVVDDAEDNRNLIGLYLKKFPYLIDMAENGAQSIDKCRLNNYDLILMDIQMPVMDGYTAIKEIKRLEKGKENHTPIIVFTANALESNKDESYKAGCDDYLVKPVQKKELLTTIKKYLN